MASIAYPVSYACCNSEKEEMLSQMQTIKYFAVALCVTLLGGLTASAVNAATRVGTIVYVNLEETYAFTLYGRDNQVVRTGKVANTPYVDQYEIGVYRSEIRYANGNIEQLQFTLAPGQQIFVTGNQTTMQIGSTVGATTVRIESGGAISHDSGSSYSLETAQVDTSQFGDPIIPAIREVTSEDALYGIETLLKDGFVPITGAEDEAMRAVPVLTVHHNTAHDGRISRDYMVDGFLVDLTVGNVMCVSQLSYRDFMPCETRGSAHVIGVIDMHGDLIFDGFGYIKVRGPVQAGDKLVADGLKGYATVDNNAKYGTVIGIARTSFSGESGMVMATIGKQ